MLAAVRTSVSLLFLGLLVAPACGSTTPATTADNSAAPAAAGPVAAAPEAALPSTEPAAEPSGSNADAPAALPAAPLPDRDPELAHRLVADHGAILLDVRTPAEFEQGHVENATLIPHDQVASRIDEVKQLAGNDLHKPIVVYCGSGRRAGEAKRILEEQGFTHVTNLGGYEDW